jgi:hypothetical protein
MGEDWVARCLKAAAAKHEIGPEASSVIEGILRDDGGCRKLTAAEITKAASDVLAAPPAQAPAEQTEAGPHK